MDVREVDDLLGRLTGSLASIQEILAGIDLETPAHPDSYWRIREILSHLASWDRQVTRSIRAYIEGTEYAIPGLEINTFNEEATQKQKALTSQQVYGEWTQARQDFIDAVRAVPLDRFTGDLLYPWGNERGSVSLVVRYMVAHDREHKGEILRAIEAAFGE